MSEWDDQRKWEAYFQALAAFCSAPEFAKLLRIIGTPQEAEEKLLALGRMIEAAERRAWLWANLKIAAGLFFGIGAALTVISNAWPLIAAWIAP